MKTNHVKWGLAVLVAMAILLPGIGSTTEAAYRNDNRSYGHSNTGRAYSKHHYQNRDYRTYHNHRGYWENRNGLQFFIRVD